MRTRIFFGGLLALSLTFGAAALSLVGIDAGAVAHAQDGDKAKPPKMNPKVLKPLQEALKLANEGKYPEAEVQLRKVDEVQGKTPFEQYQVDELAGFVAIKQNKYGDAVKAYERALQSGQIPAEQVNDRLALLARLYFQSDIRDLAKVADYGGRYLQASGSKDPAMLGLVGQAAYFQDDFASAERYMKQAVDAAAAAGAKPEENWLLILQSSYAKLQNAEGVTDATLNLLKHYPRKEHWITMSSGLLSRAANKDREILQVFRLMQAAGAMDGADDFSEAANVAIRAGFPGDAQRFLEAGYAAGILDKSGDLARNQQLLDEAKRLATADLNSLPQFEKEAAASKDGEADVKLGEAYLSYQQPAKAIEALQRGLAKGGVKSQDEAQLALGRAHLAAGNGAEAQKAFAQVKSPEFVRIAELWTVLAGQTQ